jgi:hypothetical protein|tara:strand:+ start:1168 stop:1671 length:504 start_codon:yes stop_codon:yes gene_type:complete
MGKIKPTLTISSNSDSATATPGPLDIALSLSTKPNADTLNAARVDAATYTCTTTLHELIDGSATMADQTGGSTYVAGSVGCYIYMKHTATSGTDKILVGIVAGGGSDTPTHPAASGTTALDETTNATLRTFTLNAGEFAFFPWDYTGDIFVESSAGTPVLEYWLFHK